MPNRGELPMRFEMTDSEGISSKGLTVHAETPAEVMEVFKHFRLVEGMEGALQLAQAIQAGSYTHTIEGKREWFEVDVYLDRALTPYKQLLARITGFDESEPLPDVDLTTHYPHRLGYTHITDSIEIVDGMLHAHVFIQDQDWNNMNAATNAQRNADDYIQESVGKRKHEREFIRAGNGHFVENPNYARRRHLAEPGLGAPWLWDVLFSWWRTSCATDAQRDLLDRIDALSDGKYGRDYQIRQGGQDEASLIGWHMYALDPQGKCNYDGKGKMTSVYTWEQFAKLGKAAA